LQVFGEFIQRLQVRAGRKGDTRSLPVPAQATLLAPQEPGEGVGVDGAREDSAGAVLDDLLNTIQYERYLYDTLEERPAQNRWQNVLELTGCLKRKADEDELSL